MIAAIIPRIASTNSNSISVKPARKGDRLDPREVDALLEALDETVWVPNCPHGSPIALTLGRAELERRILRR